MTRELSHILVDLEALAEKRKAEADSFDPSTFMIKDKTERLARAEMDELYFCKEYFPDDFPADFGAVHSEWRDIYNRRDHELHLVLGPRSGGKSQELRGMRIHKMIFKKFRNGARGGENLNDAENEIEATKIEFEMNPRILHDFGSLVNKKSWSNKKLRLKNGVSLRAISPNIKGKGFLPRLDYVEIDDFEDEESIANRERGRKKLNWLIKELYPALTKDSVIIWLGNDSGLDSAAHQYREDLEETPKKKLFVHVFQALYDVRQSDGTYKQVSFWPENWTVEELLELKETIGTAAFEAEMQQNPMRPGDKFKLEWITTIELAAIAPDMAKRRAAIFLDPSYGESDTACFKAIGLMSSDGVHYDIMDAWIRQSTIQAMFHALIEMYWRWKAAGWNITSARFETTLAQKLLWKDYEEVSAARKQDIPLGGTGKDKFFQVPKPIRIETLSMPMETGRLRFVTQNGQLSPDLKRLREMFMNYPSKPDDGPDAISGCYHLLEQSIIRGERPGYKSLIKRIHNWKNRS